MRDERDREAARVRERHGERRPGAHAQRGRASRTPAPFELPAVARHQFGSGALGGHTSRARAPGRAAHAPARIRDIGAARCNRRPRAAVDHGRDDLIPAAHERA
jgi:hypothetical protein